MPDFVKRYYEIQSPKLQGKAALKIALLADLHGAVYGHRQDRLLQAIEAEDCDLVLAAGDMILRIRENSFTAAKDLLIPLSKQVPVCYGLGNHEEVFLYDDQPGGEAEAFSVLQHSVYRRKRLPPKEHHLIEDYRTFESALEEAGVILLKNQRVRKSFHSVMVDICGLRVPYSCYHKPFPFGLHASDIELLCGSANQEAFQILIAHSPYFAPAYFTWQADLTVSGHYHGGILRLGKRRGLVSPYLHPFPSYCVGDFHRGDSHLVVSAGLGEHTLPVRLFNPHELVFITVKNPEEA
ncbi:MAG: metallophosphoesterase [Blautia sp.]|nr:metallophosphoesterase [Blautia sp.]